MSKFLRWGVLAIALALVLGSLVYSHYVLDSQKLDAAIRTELPPGTPKAQVIQFIQKRKPEFCDDLGTHVEARLSGRAGNLIYRRDIILDFKFDANGRLLSFSKKVYLTFV
jgi:hypothetical protein